MKRNFFKISQWNFGSTKFIINKTFNFAGPNCSFKEDYIFFKNKSYPELGRSIWTNIKELNSEKEYN